MIFRTIISITSVIVCELCEASAQAMFFFPHQVDASWNLFRSSQTSSTSLITQLIIARSALNLNHLNTGFTRKKKSKRLTSCVWFLRVWSVSNWIPAESWRFGIGLRNVMQLWWKCLCRCKKKVDNHRTHEFKFYIRTWTCLKHVNKICLKNILRIGSTFYTFQ